MNIQTKKETKYVTLSNNEMIILPEHDFISYRIPLIRLTNLSDLVCWLYHLTEKDWVTNDIIREFIEVAYNSIDKKEVYDA